MCGRFTLTTPDQLALRFDVTEDERDDAERPHPAYNIAPSQDIPVIVERSAGRLLRAMSWGFRPAWASAAASRPAPINARAETLRERPLFRGAIVHGRCIIPADGFYEWQRIPGRKTKQPVYIRRDDRALVGFAGLYSAGKDGTASCAIITTEPNGLVARIHDRMPAILDPAAESLWLDPALTDPVAVLDCLRPCPADLLVAYPVSPRVSSPREDGPSLIEPLTA
jgi:putative SOS response-associated peptidase YedK